MTNNLETSPASADSINGFESGGGFPDGRACFRELMSNVNLFAVMFNSKAEIIYANGYFVRKTEWSYQELMGRGWNEVFATTWAGDFTLPFSDLHNSGPNALHHECELLSGRGERHWVRWNSIPLRDPSGLLVGVASIGEDITERRHLERELLDSSGRERRHLQGEIHDGLGQELFGLGLLARSLSESARRDNNSIADGLDRLSVDLNHALDTCRRISRGFSPLSDMPGGLIDALRNLATIPKDWSGPALEFSLRQTVPLKLPAESLDHIYRLAQEALTNALRHADASLIRIILDIQRTTVTLEILDDGVGLPQAGSSEGMGLKLMRYRANVLRADIRVALGSPRGTHVIFRMEQ